MRDRPLHAKRVYSATVNLGLVQGLPQLGVKVSNVKPMGDNEYLAVRDWARHLRVLLYTSQGRIVDVGTPCR